MIAAITRPGHPTIRGRCWQRSELLVVGFAVVGGGVEDRLSVGGFLDPDAESSRVADVLEDDFATGSYGFVLVLSPNRGVGVLREESTRG